MADVPPAAPSDRDLTSMAEARALARKAKSVAAELAELSQEQIDAIVGAVATAATAHAEAFARMAIDETGFGVFEDKIQKNLFASQRVYDFIKPMKTVGVVARHDNRRVIEIAEPFGVVAAIVPSTNPTSTTIYKVLIALKARCPIVISPHPSAVACITRVAEVLDEAARRAGAPAGAINWMHTVTLEGTQELMKHRDVAVILATGGMGLVRAAYSAGKPAYGVGPGNAPAYIERTAQVRKAVRDIITGKTFDNGVLCSSENSVVVDAPIADEVKREFQAQGGYYLSHDQAAAVARVLVTPQRLPNPSLVGKSAVHIAERCGITVPADTRVLIAQLEGVGRDHPLSIEKLCPVLSLYVVRDWREGCERCKQILRYGGMGHTMSVHSQNDQVILEFGLKKPAFRIAVNSPSSFGSIGLTTGLEPALTLGCGGYGGNITSDNISPRHLLNVKRLAYEVASVPNRFERAAGAPSPRASVSAGSAGSGGAGRSAGLSADVLTARIDQFLTARGFAPPAEPRVARTAPADGPVAAGSSSTAPPAGAAPGAGASSAPATPARTGADVPQTFVCEDDVRRAMREGRVIVIAERAIVTPSARELGEQHRLFRTPDVRH